METGLIVRSMHILFGLLWAGGGIYRMVVVQRNMSDPGFRDDFFARGIHGPYMGLTSLGTVAFGGGMFAYGEYTIENLGSGGFIVLMTGVTAATLAFLLGWGAHLPTDLKIRPLAQQAAAGALDSPTTYEALIAREHVLGRVSSTLIVIAVLGMTTWRWF